MKISSLLLALLLVPAGASAQTTVVPFQPGLTASGITYYLPSTTLRFVVTATRTTHTPGPYATYAERFLDIHDAPLTTFDEWTLDDISLVAYGTPDVSQGYSIALNPKSLAPLVTLTADGILLAVNDETALPSPLPRASVIQLASTTAKPDEFLTPEILRATSMVKKAELAAQEIYDIRENRSLIAKGLADFNPTDGTQLQLMLSELDRSERGIMQQFIGTTQSARYTFTFDVTPQPSDPSSERTPQHTILFRFSRHLGVVDADDLAGEPFTLTVTDETTLPAPVIDPKTKKPVDPSSSKSKVSQDLRYRVPGRARISIEGNGAEHLSAISPIAQFGRVEHLGGELFKAGKVNTKVQLNAVTGNIEHITTEPVMNK